jgi:2-polyprenyl-3-methyl-5-hydroxy-6-metoxy-1,4-benzoquinol methylase
MKFGEELEKNIISKNKSNKVKKVYNTTDLDPEMSFNRHIFHRDQFAHYLRWTHILKVSKIGDKVVDFGCGSANLLEVLYRNRFKCEKYTGIDIRQHTVKQASEKFSNVDWADFICEDLVTIENGTSLISLQADKVCSFEVIEHVGKQNADVFLQNFRECGNDRATYYLSTPNFDEKVGAANNHTYDSGDGRGLAIQEFSHNELKQLLLKYFDVVEYFGTFASEKDYKPFMNDWQVEMFEALKEYYDSNLISNIMAPMFPAQSRNTLWVLKRKSN